MPKISSRKRIKYSLTFQDFILFFVAYKNENAYNNIPKEVLEPKVPSHNPTRESRKTGLKIATILDFYVGYKKSQIHKIIHCCCKPK